MYLDDPQTKGGPSVIQGTDQGAFAAFTASAGSALENTSLGAGAKLLAGMGYKDDQSLDEKGYETSPYAREGGFQPGMTVAQAIAYAAKYDSEHLQAATQGHGVASFLGGATGGLMDPLFYIPYLDALAPAMKAAAIARRGEIFGEAATQTLNATAAAALEQPLIYAKDKAYGEDYDVRDAINSVATAAIGGGVFGGLAGKMKLRYAQKVAGQQKALEDIHMGRDVDTAPVVNPTIQPSDEQLRMQAMPEARTPDDEAFLKSMADDGGKSYYESKLAELDERKNPEQRKALEEMSPTEKDAEILRLRKENYTDDLTGIPNRRAFDEREPMPAQVSTDLDNLKDINDEMGHEGGDMAIQHAAQAMHEEFTKVGGKAYRGGERGDEFKGEAPTPEAAQQAIQAVKQRLDSAKIKVQHPDGTVVSKTGMGISYGTGADDATAEAGLRADKAARQKAGLRHLRDVERVPGEAAPGVQDNLSRASRLAYYKERLAAVSHRQPDWTPTGPRPQAPEEKPQVEMTDADKARMETVEQEASKLEDMAAALKRGASCFGIQ